VTRLGPLRGRDFRILFAAEAVSVLGDMLVPVALAFAVLNLTGSASDLGAVLLASFVPRILLMVAGGVWGDRLSRRRLMVNSHLLRFVSQGLQGALLVGGHASIATLVALQIVRGAGVAVYRPAAIGLIPTVVEDRELQPANALLWAVTNLAGLVGPAVAGALVATVGPGWAILGDSASFLFAAVLLLRLPREELGRTSAPGNFLRELSDGWSEVRRRTWVWASICFFACFQLVYFSSFSVLGPIVAKRSLGGVGPWAAIAACAAAGGLLGNLLAFRLQPRRPLVVAYGFGASAAASLVLLGLAAPTAAIAAAELVAGIAIGFGDTLWHTTLQRGVPAQALSRVASYDSVGSIALRPIGLALVGPIVALAGTRGTLLGAAAIVVASSAAMLLVPAIRAIEAVRPLPEAEEPPRRLAVG
jgi:MFS family permease